MAAIPEAYQDVSSVTATAADVLANKIIVNASGETVAGTMANNGAVSKTLDATTGNQSYAVPKGYHSGTGSVGIVLEEKSATPTKSAQTVTPTSGKVLSKVTVAAIPAEYISTADANATAAQILDSAHKIARLESEGDRVYRHEMAYLFDKCKDPIELIKWKDILENLEETLDHCEKLSDMIRGVVMKYA